MAAETSLYGAFDTHCHLTSPQLRPQCADLMLRAHAAGVVGLVNVGYDWETSCLALEQCKTMAPRTLNAICSVGIQPHDAHTFTPHTLGSFEGLIQTESVIAAVGEIGLDYFYDLSPRNIQIQCFEAFLDLACTHKKPVIVHVRESFEDVFTRLKIRVSQGLRGVIHCFTGLESEAKAFLDLGFYISFSGIATFKNGRDLLRIAASVVPDDRLLIETDSPYLAPVPHRGKPNEPAWVTHVAQAIALAKGQSSQHILNLTTANAHKLFFHK